MPGPLDEFLSSISVYGVAKTSHFRFRIPGITTQLLPGINDTLGIRCEATEFPGRQLVSNDSRIYGPTYKTPYQSVYQEITLTFVETANFEIRKFFEVWMDTVFNSGTNLLSYPSNTRFDAYLSQYDVMFADEQNQGKGLRTIAGWHLYHTVCTAVNQMPVSWSEDGLHRTTATLAFEYYDLWTTDQSAINSDQGSIKPGKFPPTPPKGSSDGIFSSLKSKFT